LIYNDTATHPATFTLFLNQLGKKKGKGCNRLRQNENVALFCRRPYAFQPLKEQSLALAFDRVNAAWKLIKPPTRKAQLNVNFVMRKLLELLGYHEDIDRIPIVKTNKTRKQLEIYWAEILSQQLWVNFEWLPPTILQT
jgi:hypothetical protein